MQVGAFAFLRLVASLVRINRNLARLCDIEAERLEVDKHRLSMEYPKPSKVGRKTEFQVASVDILNRSWEDRINGSQ